MNRHFPLKKLVELNSTSHGFLSDYSSQTEIPVGVHPGSYGFVRKNHTHEGIDLYSNKGDEIVAIEDGVVLGIFPFTGAQAESTWWEDTECIMIQSAHKNHTINYGELSPIVGLKEGDAVSAGSVIGFAKTVLKEDKGRPMTMLHLEMFEKGKEAIVSWNENKPVGLLDPTEYLIEIAQENNLFKNKKSYKPK